MDYYEILKFLGSKKLCAHILLKQKNRNIINYILDFSTQSFLECVLLLFDTIIKSFFSYILLKKKVKDKYRITNSLLLIQILK